VKVCRKEGVGEVVSPHYQVMVNDLDTVAFIYEPMACHNYNKIHIDGAPVQIATIDTMLSLYLAFLYSKREYYSLDRLLCMAKFLYEVQEKNRLNQKGVLKRFSINCYGRQETIEDMRAEKTVMFNKLKTERSSKEYEEWFLKYRPGGIANAEIPTTTTRPAKKKKPKASSKTRRKNKNKNKTNASRKTSVTKKTRSNKKRTSRSKKTRKDRVNHYLKGLMGRKKK
jgi:Mg-chelatase subunit ChlI